MSEPAEKLDPVWEEFDRLSTQLLAVAVRLFESRRCLGAFTVLPGTSTCAADLAANTVANLIVEGYWHPGTGGQDPFPIGYRMMHRDFLDLIKSQEHIKAEIMDPADAEQLLGSSNSSSDQERTEAELTVASFRRPLANDPQALELLELVLTGVEKRADQARKMKITEQEVTNIKRRLMYKIRRWEQSFWHNKDQ